MLETATCPKCQRHLQLPGDYLGRQVQCPSCEAMFIAGEARPQPLPPSAPQPDAIAAEPTQPGAPASAPKTDDVDMPRRKPRRARDLPGGKPTTPGAKSRFAPLMVVLGVTVAVLAGCWCVVSPPGRWGRNNGGWVNPPQPFANVKQEAPQDVEVAQPPPVVAVPDRMLTPQEQKEHAKIFFDHFSAVMRRPLQNPDTAGEMGSFDAGKLLDKIFEQKFIPEAWRNQNDRLVAQVRKGVLQTSVYRGDHWWGNFQLVTIKQPRVGELIVSTRHPDRDTNTSLKLRWWLVHREGRWRIQEMEDLSYGVRLSLLVAAGLEANQFGFAPGHADLRALRDAANEIIVKSNFDEAGRRLAPLVADNLPKAAAATYNLLEASVRLRQQRHEDTLTWCDAAQKLQPDMPGSDYLRAFALHNLHRDDLALQSAKRAQDWLGDEPSLCHEMGLVLHNLRRFREAAACYRKVLDEQPDHQNAMLSLLRCIGPDVKNDDIAARFLKMKRPHDHFEPLAQDCWTARDASTLLLLAQAMKGLEPNNADAHYFLALAYGLQQRMAPALAAFRLGVGLQDLAGRRDLYYTEFARAVAGRDDAVQTYAALPDAPRAFRSLADALKNLNKMDELRQLVDLHVKKHPQDDFVHLYRAELYLRDEEYKLADQEFTKAFAALNDFALLNRFRYSRVRARYQIGDVVGAYRDMPPSRETFRQLADSCWFDKNADALANLVDAHAKNDRDDPQVSRSRWRVHVLAKRFAQAGKIVKAAAAKNQGVDGGRFLVQDFIFDLVDNGYIVEAYRYAPDAQQALEILALDLNGAQWSKDLEAIAAEHRRRFPDDPTLDMLAGKQAAAKQEWAKAAHAYADGWKKLPDANRLGWTYSYLYARVKEGQAVLAYHETGQKAEHFRTLANLLLVEKQIDGFEKLLAAHRPQRLADSEFDAFDARLQVLRGQAPAAVELLAAVLKGRPQLDQRRIGDAFLADLAPFDVAIAAYRCLPDKMDAFGQMIWRYRNAERVKEFARLLDEHAKHHPDDPRLVTERAELHLLRNEFALAEKQFLLAKGQAGQGVDPTRFGLIRVRIKLGKTAEAYRELGPCTQSFHDIAYQCINQKDGAQLDRLIAAHRQAFPAAKNLAAWDVEVHWLKKDYAATIKAIEADRADLLKNATFRWKCESYLVRSLVRAKKPAEAVRAAETIGKRKDAPRVLLALALASTGDVKRVLDFLETKRGQRFFIEDCYHDEDLGPLLRGDAFREVQKRFPPPPERKGPNNGPFYDDWD